MRILVVTPWFPTAESPVSGVFVRREVEALADRHEVTVLHLDWQRGTPSPPAPGHGYGYRHESLRRSDPRSYTRARRVVSQAALDHDVVHTHALTGLLPWLTGRPGQGRAWVHSEHWSGISAPETLGTGERAALRILGPRLDHADAVIAESTRLADAIRRFRSAPIDIVPCVVDAPAALAPRPTAGVPLLSVGGLIPRKGPLLALDAMATLVERGVDASLTWVGEGPLGEEMRAEARRRGVSDRLRLPGRLDDDGVSRELAAAAMFLLPTQGDNFCVVTAEALVHGRPIVSGVATGAVDYADPAVSRFVSVQDGPAYADAVQSLVETSRHLSAEDVAETVSRRFLPSTVAAALTGIYERAVDRARRPM
ncbi:glycosyltransferase family 4 protein [Microbacterium sp. SSW1-49]|uniref:Glycosyltransferase family 4 protein n=1 Tax=Microbacterium croceum TaxID=2851645 RepID=A0ABT0FE34_9MICO|nr:glycosyltransferase family 4 protein [Microbacterium croceum]MCK2036328.1 glycosyltransferase family 4 protein [Microbacterium croceum]